MSKTKLRGVAGWIALSALVITLLGPTTGVWSWSDSSSTGVSGVLQQNNEDGGVTEWTGTVHSTFLRSSRWAGASYTSDGDLWFTVDEDGNISGHATIVHRPTFDVNGLNSILDTIKALGAEMFGALIPLPLASFNPALLQDALKVRAEWDSAMYTQQGPIQGTLNSEGNLSIEWSEDLPAASMGLTVYFDKIGDISEVISDTEMAASLDWPSQMQVSEHDGRPQLIATEDDASTGEDGITEASAVTVSAHPT